jgi:hypothetical protein
LDPFSIRCTLQEEFSKMVLLHKLEDTWQKTLRC